MRRTALHSSFVIRHSGFVIPAMFLAHSIRLRNPWQRAATEGGGTRWSRHFHRPTGLEPDDQLLLVLSDLPVDVVVRVNGRTFALSPIPHSPFPTSHPASSNQQPAPPPIAQQFDLTPILADANEIEIEIPLDPLRRVVAPRLPASFPYDARLAIIGHS
jgi:hypothetical protein